MPDPKPGVLDQKQLQSGWTPRRVGLRIRLLDETDSTNRAALEAATEPDADGLAVLAEYQSAGRGRLGRSWASPRGASVLCSVLLLEPFSRSGDARDELRLGGRLTLTAAVAACQAVRASADITPAIRWPNDLYVGGRKCAGILIESRTLTRDAPHDRALAERADHPDGSAAGATAWVIGIGINCLQHHGHFPPEWRDRATSLELESSHPVDRTAVARELLRALDDWLAPSPPIQEDRVREAWLSFAEPIGRPIRLRGESGEFRGTTVDVDPAGGLIVQDQNGRRAWFDPLRTSRL